MQMRNQLVSRRTSALVASGKLLEPALVTFYRLIMTMAPQVPASHREDSRNVGFLRGALVRVDWATEPFSRVATQGLAFQQLYSELVSSLQFHIGAEEASSKKGSMNPPAASSTFPRIMRTDILFAGQGIDRRAKTGVGATIQACGGLGSCRGIGTLERLEGFTVAGCFSDDHPGHMVKYCETRTDTTQQTKCNMEYCAKKGGRPVAPVILYILTKQLHAIVDVDGKAGTTTCTTPLEVAMEEYSEHEAAVCGAMMLLDGPDAEEGQRGDGRKVHFSQGA